VKNLSGNLRTPIFKALLSNAKVQEFMEYPPLLTSGNRPRNPVRPGKAAGLEKVGGTLRSGKDTFSRSLQKNKFPEKSIPPIIPRKNREKGRPAKNETPRSIIPDECTTVVSL
jgi:hypothetical protein